MDTNEPQPFLVDSHAHLDMGEFDADRDDVVRRALAAGVGAILCPADLVSPRSLFLILELRKAFASVVAAAGVHPHQAKDFSEDHMTALADSASRGEVRAVGEIGLDYHYTFSPPDVQRRVLARQLAAAKELRIPVILHSRLSGADIVAAVDAERFDRGGILHCFTEDWDVAEAMIDRGFLISFSGILTFPKAQGLRDVAVRVPLDRLVVETDAPFLAPVPYRESGQRNEPAYVVETARVLAGVKGLPFAELARATTENFARVFPFEKTPPGC